jgi:hypothetical protein
VIFLWGAPVQGTAALIEPFGRELRFFGITMGHLAIGILLSVRK